MKRKEVNKDQATKEVIRTIFERYNNVYRQIQLFLLQDHGLRINHKRVLHLMHQMRLRSRIRRKYRNQRMWTIGDRVVKSESVQISSGEIQ